MNSYTDFLAFFTRLDTGVFQNIHQIENVTKMANGVIIVSPESVLIKEVNSSLIESDHETVYTEISYTKAKRIFSRQIKISKLPITKEDELYDSNGKCLFERDSLWEIVKFCAPKCNSFIFDPSTKTGMINTKKLFNTFVPIPVSAVKISSEDSNVITIMQFIVDVFGVEKKEYFLNLVSYIFVNMSYVGFLITFNVDTSVKWLIIELLSLIFTKTYVCCTIGVNKIPRDKLLIFSDECTNNNFGNITGFSNFIVFKNNPSNNHSRKTDLIFDSSIFRSSYVVSKKLDDTMMKALHNDDISGSNKTRFSKTTGETESLKKKYSVTNKLRNLLIERWEKIKYTFNGKSLAPNSSSEYKCKITG
jgi:hypothetical protein